MVTGDNIITATAIGKECHILPDYVDLNNLTKNEIEENPNEINNKNDRDRQVNY